jgi:hypothetical protein
MAMSVTDCYASELPIACSPNPVNTLPAWPKERFKRTWAREPEALAASGAESVKAQ